MTEDILNAPIGIHDPTDDAVHIAILVDESGSMAGCAAETIKNLNGYIDEQATSDKPVLLSVYTFESNNGVKTRYANVNAKKAAHLGLYTENLDANLTYHPTGGTPLYDAIGEVVQSQEADTATLIVILTDGAENASREFNGTSIRELIKQQEEKGWTFVFLMAGLSRHFAESYTADLMGRNYVGATMSYSKGMENQAFDALDAATADWADMAREVKTSGGIINSGLVSQSFLAEDQRDLDANLTKPKKK